MTEYIPAIFSTCPSLFPDSEYGIGRNNAYKKEYHACRNLLVQQVSCAKQCTVNQQATKKHQKYFLRKPQLTSAIRNAS